MGTGMTTGELAGIVLGGISIVVGVVGFLFVRNVRRTSNKVAVKDSKVGGDVVGGDKTTRTGSGKP
ncbi:MAG TPA: hypothetical protein VK539_17855 [Myxococcaceae bacterium]|nr:hypothetical protein [Myxococcaceae bacterium]